MKKGDETLILVVSKQAKQVDVFATVRLVLTRQKTAAASLFGSLISLPYDASG